MKRPPPHGDRPASPACRGFEPRRAAALLRAGLLLALFVAGPGPACDDGVETPHSSSAPSAAPVWFAEVGSASGIDFRHVPYFERRFWFPEIIGSGLGFLDHDGDGDLDLYAVQSGDLRPGGRALPGNKLYRNDGSGTFTDVTDQAGVGYRGYGMGCAAADYDGDGDSDLYVTNYGPNVLYRNEGDGTFRDVTAAAGVGHDGWGMSAAFVDVDADQDLDLFVTNYVIWSPETEIECTSKHGTRDYCEPINYNAPAPAVLYRNDGDGTFTDVSERSGLHEAFGNGMGVACGDFDRDGLDDVYVANDGVPNQLWMNRGGGMFEDTSLLAGCAVNADGYAQASMGVGAADVDEDGDMDLFMTHLRGETNTLYVNQGDGRFADCTARSGLGRPSLRYTGFGMGFADFDHDGLLDLYVVDGRVGFFEPTFGAQDPYAEPDLLFRGVGGGRFEEVAPQAGTAEPYLGNSRGLALGDVDADGDVDLAVLDNGGRLRLLRNVLASKGRWAILSVRNAAGADAIGAQVEIDAGGRTRRRRVDPAFSYLSTNDPRLHIGLGEAARIDEVRVRWPDGTLERFGPLAPDAVHELRQGAGRAR